MFENCEQIQENLLFHLNGEEDESSDLIIRNHLENCPTCRKKRESLAILEGLLSNLPRKALVGDELGQDYVAPLLLSLPEKEAPAYLAEKILCQVRKERKKEVPSLVSWRTLRLVEPLAAALFIVFLSVLGFRSIGSRSSYTNYLNCAVSIEKSLYFHTLNGKKDGTGSIQGIHGSESKDPIPGTRTGEMRGSPTRSKSEGGDG